MALWQFKIELIPSAWSQTHSISELFSEEGCDTSPAWIGYEKFDELCEHLGKLLPRGHSWHKELIVLGNDEESDIQLWVEDAKVEALSIRFDLRNNCYDLIRGVVELARNFRLSIIAVESKTLLNLTEHDLLNAALCSSAAQFVKSPKDFFRLH